MKHRIYVAKCREHTLVWSDDSRTWRGMWYSFCTCGKHWQFWFFGATLGYGLEHLRREHGALRSTEL